MIVMVRVDVATHRPVGMHDFVCVNVHVSDSISISKGIVEAQLIACQMACCHPFVEMPMASTVIEITEV